MVCVCVAEYKEVAQLGCCYGVCVAECKEVTQFGCCYGGGVGGGRGQRGRTVTLLLCVCGRVQRGRAVPLSWRPCRRPTCRCWRAATTTSCHSAGYICSTRSSSWPTGSWSISSTGPNMCQVSACPFCDVSASTTVICVIVHVFSGYV